MRLAFPIKKKFFVDLILALKHLNYLVLMFPESLWLRQPEVKKQQYAEFEKLINDLVKPRKLHFSTEHSSRSIVRYMMARGDSIDTTWKTESRLDDLLSKFPNLSCSSN